MINVLGGDNVQTVYRVVDNVYMDSEHHDVMFAPDDLDAAVAFVNRYIPALRTWLTTGEVGEFYRSFDHKKNVEFLTADQVDAEVANVKRMWRDRCPRLELVVVNGCNFACAHCSAVAPLVDHVTCVDVEQLTALLTQLQRLCSPAHAPLAINIFGGEPLLHPRLPEVIATVRRFFPDVRLGLTTNGALLQRPTKLLLTALRVCRCSVSVSVYGPGVYFKSMNWRQRTKANLFDCRMCRSNTQVVNVDSSAMGFTVNKACTSLYPNGDLLFCSSLGTAYALQALGYAAPLTAGDDYVNIFDLQTADQLLAFFNRLGCSFACYCQRPKLVPWCCSTGQASEWISG